MVSLRNLPPPPNPNANRSLGCGITVHYQCLPSVTHICATAFRADQVRAAFVRCFASLFYTYRRHMHSPTPDQRKSGLLYHFHMDAFLKSVPHGNGEGEYMHLLRHTQAFNEFIHERETTRAEDPRIKLFDEIILSKRNRGRASFFSKSNTSFLNNVEDHLWRSASATPPNTRFSSSGAGGPGAGDPSRSVVSGRTPAKLDPALMKEPRSIQGAPRLVAMGAKTRRKPVASMLGLHARSAGE